MNKTKLKKSIIITVIIIMTIYLFDYRESFLEGLLVGLK